MSSQRKLITALTFGGGIHEQTFCLSDRANRPLDWRLEAYQGGNIMVEKKH